MSTGIKPSSRGYTADLLPLNIHTKAGDSPKCDAPRTSSKYAVGQTAVQTDIPDVGTRVNCRSLALMQSQFGF